MKGLLGSSDLSVYLRAIDQVPLLSYSQERMLSERIAQGDARAREILVSANLRLVVTIARQYRRKGLEFEDLIEEGNIGLIQAADRYNGTLGVRFATYAAYWIRHTIRTALTDKGRTIRLPSHMVASIQRWRRKAAELTGANKKPPTPQEVGAALGLSAQQTAMVVRALPVYCAMGPDRRPGDDTRGLDSLTEEEGHLANSASAESESREEVEEHLSHLRPRDAAILRLRFGLGTGSPLTLAEVSQRLDLSRERVRQLEHHALQDLAEVCGAHG